MNQPDPRDLLARLQLAQATAPNETDVIAEALQVLGELGGGPREH
jgi:hypothetical protein